MIKTTPKLSLIASVITVTLALSACKPTTQETKSPESPQQLATTTQTAETSIEAKIDALLAQMTLAEKIGQTALRGTSSREKGKVSDELLAKVRSGQIGAFLNVMNAENVDELQRVAVEESRLGIPLIFSRDVVHGFKTIFPIPLGLAASWNKEAAYNASRIAAEEATTAGIRWTFAPMVDISRDARWGRIAESLGEDPYLASELTKAMVNGFQTDDLSQPNTMAATVKHFAAYGAAEGGRDYATVSMSEQDLRDVYLPPFKAAADVGAASFMNAFNEVNGVPATGNRFLLQDILRDEWQYDGFVVSDWNSVIEMIAHGYAKDEKEAAYRAAWAGMDMEMTSKTYDKHLTELIKEGRIDEKRLDEFVRNILRIKFKLGLFDKPYRRQDGEDKILSAEHKAKAKQAAIESMVMLKNNKQTLPLNKSINNLALIGPLADAPHDQMGTWVFDGRGENSITPRTTLTKMLGDRLHFAKGLKISRTRTNEGFADAIAAAKKSDAIVFVAGEESILSGEAHSRANINLPGAQEELILELAKLDKPLILVIMAGRPITLGNILESVDAVLFAWHPGTMAGPALTDLLFGDASPSGRLPVTWPKEVGQIPIYYNHKNTGRPPEPEKFVQMYDIPVGAWQSSLGNDSHYLDAGYLPQYPFGYGLSYSNFKYGKASLSTNTIKMEESLIASITITNTGKVTATETVQLYIRDLFADITRPVRELKGYERVELAAGESKTVSFTLSTDDLAFHNQQMEKVTEPGDFHLWIAPNAASGEQLTFTVTK